MQQLLFQQHPWRAPGSPDLQKPFVMHQSPKAEVSAPKCSRSVEAASWCQKHHHGQAEVGQQERVNSTVYKAEPRERLWSSGAEENTISQKGF